MDRPALFPLLPLALPAPAPPKTSGMAIASLVLGILSLLAGLTAIPAIITGYIALSAVKRSGGVLTGSRMAHAGLILGHLGVFVLLISILAAWAAPGVIRQRANADEDATMANMRLLHRPLLEWSKARGAFPKDGKEFLDLENAGYIANQRDALSVGKGRAGHWRYYPAARDPRDPLLGSPPDTYRKRILTLRVDGSIIAHHSPLSEFRGEPVMIPAPRR